MKKTLAVLAVGTVLPLFAHAGIRYGAQLSTVTPTGHLAHHQSKQGISLGGFADYDVRKGHAIVAELNAMRLGSRNDINVSNISLGANYKMQINQLKGVYGLVGVDVERARDRSRTETTETVLVEGATEPTTTTTKKSEHKYANKIGYTVGAGYDLNKNLGVQVRYNVHSCSYKKADATDAIDATKSKSKSKSTSRGTVSLGVTYTF